MSTLTLCSLRNTECMICLESYGSIQNGIRLSPLILTCGKYLKGSGAHITFVRTGHDLCDFCCNLITDRTCPLCRRTAVHASKPLVEYHKINMNDGSEEKLAILVGESGEFEVVKDFVASLETTCNMMRNADDAAQCRALEVLIRTISTIEKELADWPADTVCHCVKEHISRP